MTTPRSHRDSAAPQPSRTPLVVAVVVALVLVAGLVAWLVTRSSGNGDAAEAPVFGEVSIEGEALPVLPEGADPSTDPAVGTVAPVATGADFIGQPVTLESGGQPTVLLFLAHWCPHCQREVPAMQEWLDGGGLPEGTQVLSVATAQDSTLPNFPPAAWLEEEGWTPPVLVDDESSTAATAFGLRGFPFWVFLDSAGNVAARASGEIDPEAIGEVLASLP
jgi:cytochrome c biogenesis protein CcmG, thiol:disulfide interchange protein DsbE